MVTALELRDRALLDSVLSVTPMDPVSLPPVLCLPRTSELSLLQAYQVCSAYTTAC